MYVRIEQSIGHKSSKNTSIHRCLYIRRTFPIGSYLYELEAVVCLETQEMEAVCDCVY